MIKIFVKDIIDHLSGFSPDFEVADGTFFKTMMVKDTVEINIKIQIPIKGHNWVELNGDELKVE